MIAPDKSWGLNTSSNTFNNIYEANLSSSGPQDASFEIEPNFGDEKKKYNNGDDGDDIDLA